MKLRGSDSMVQAQRCQGIKSDALAAPIRVQKHVHVK